ncbi:MAG: hypothetical protein HC770_11800 [Pseudanabaena sp. CRU_2_10]|nr:hypothetical protein [Pseudanabaena sp. CRU_2_10]
MATKVNFLAPKQPSPFSLVKSNRPVTSAELDRIVADLDQIAPDLDMMAANLELIALDSGPSKLGEILVRQNLVSEDVLAIALEEQRFSQKKVGEIMIERGYLSQDELAYYIKNQGMRLGELLIENSIISQSRLNKLLNRQKRNSKKLGEVLIEQKVLSNQQLQQFLIEQYWRRHGLWLGSDSANASASI